MGPPDAFILSGLQDSKPHFRPKNEIFQVFLFENKNFTTSSRGNLSVRCSRLSPYNVKMWKINNFQYGDFKN